jgi:ribosome biogenesis GTPase / thiamine phosphate phosphatase
MYPSIEKLRTIGFDQHALQAFHPAQAEQSTKQLQLARVSNIQRDRVMLHNGETESPAQLRPALYHDLQAKGETLAVGRNPPSGKKSPKPP